MLVERELILRRVDAHLRAPEAREQQPKPRDHVANVGQRKRLAMPAPAASQVVDVEVHRRAEEIRERPEQIDDSLRVGDDVRREDAVLFIEREAVAAGAEPPPDGCFGLLAAK